MNIRDKNKLYIECETCKYTKDCRRERSRKCLIIKNGLTEKNINGKKWTSFMNYEYILWEPVMTIIGLLEDDLFEI